MDLATSAVRMYISVEEESVGDDSYWRTGYAKPSAAGLYRLIVALAGR